jgi:hypothetical protein
MQCPDCLYISFKQEKVCGCCGFSFKKAITSSPHIFFNASFTIFTRTTDPAKEQESFEKSNSQFHEELIIKVPSKCSKENLELKSEDFHLDLSDAKQVHSGNNLKANNYELNTTIFSPMDCSADVYNPEEMSDEDFYLDLSDAEQVHSGNNLKANNYELNTTIYSPMDCSADVYNPEEMSDEGLLLESFKEVPPTSETVKIKPEEIQLKVKKELEPADRNLKNIELRINDLNNTSSIEDAEMAEAEEKLEKTSLLYRGLEQDIKKPMAPILDLGTTETVANKEETHKLGNPAEAAPLDQLDGFRDDLYSEFDDVKLEKDSGKLETAHTSSQDQGQKIAAPMAPVLDLGNAEILLDIDEDFKPEILAGDTSLTFDRIDKLEIKLEIDDPDQSTIINNEKESEIKTEELRLDPEDLDSLSDPGKALPWYPFLNRKTGF